ncbi:MAG: serine/threonine-protein kinase, partial [Cyanobacteria bacterium P01_A01_bin.37]
MPSRFDASTKLAIHASQYRLLGLAGQGQFGQVYCAIHRQTGQLVALKNLEQRRFPTHQFLRELRFLLSLQHPNIVPCLAIEHTQTGRYLVMDYCEGGTLRHLMSDETHLRLACGLKLIADILTGLAHAHDRGIVHCDIKPENILLKIASKGWIAKISDFGVARLSQEHSGYKGGNTGSPAYMSPERFYGQYSQTSDLYSVGIMLFELLAGHRPFSGIPSALMNAHLNQSVVFPSSIPDALRPVIKVSLEKLSARRYETAQDMLSALHQAAMSINIDINTPLMVAEEPLIELRGVPMAYSFQSEDEQPLKTPAHCFGWSTISTDYPKTDYPKTDYPKTDYPKTASASNTPGSNEINTSHEDTSETATISDVLICYGGANSIGYACRSAGQWHSVQIPASVCDIVFCPQGCFVVASHAIYQLDRPDLGSDDEKLRLVHQFAHDCVITLEAQGKWAAVISDMRQVVPKSGFSTLSFHSLPGAQASVTLQSHPIRLKKSGLSSSLLQAIALDSCHVAVFSDIPLSRTRSSPSKTRANRQNLPIDAPYRLGTYVEVITRRGNYVSSLTLPILLGQVIPTKTPYRFLATDQYDVYSILQIDLKPFRVQRFAVPVIPKFIATAPWGYLVMNQQGHMVLLDQTGHEMNRIEGPANPTAIALMKSSELVLA